MKIVHCESSESVNFVDEHNVLVGYSLYQDCCEYASWAFHEDGKTFEDFEEIDVEELTFDTEFDGEDHDIPNLYGELGDESADAVFKLHGGGRVVYLILSNCHNGYYGHGFRMARGATIVVDYPSYLEGGETLREGTL